MDWMNPTEAARYFGIETDDELEDIVTDFGLDVEVDDDGQITAVEATFDTRAALFALHELRVGYSPADEDVKTKLDAVDKGKETKARNKRLQRRALLENRLKSRARRVSPPKQLDPPKVPHDTRQPIFWRVEEVDPDTED